MLNPASPGFIELCEDIFDELDSIEEISTTDFYNDYFTIHDEEYIPVKMKIIFFTLKNYLTGFLISKKQKEELSGYIDKHNPTDKASIELFKHYDYALQDVYAFETSLPLGALTSSQLFARTARCSEKMRTQIENLIVRHYGIFHLQSEDNQYYYFHHTGTGKDYKVLKKSFVQELDSKENEMWIITLIEWNGEYEFTGVCFPSSYKADEIRAENLKMQNKFYVFDEDTRNELDNIASEFSQSAQRFFGKQLVSYHNETECKNDVNNFMKWHQLEMQKKHADKKEKSKEPVEAPELNIDFDGDDDIALFITEKDNLEFIFGHKFLIHLLNTPPKKWSKHDRNEACGMIVADDTSSDYIKFLYRENPKGHWYKALYLSDVNESSLDFMLHFYKPYEFKFRKAPRFTSFDSSIHTKQDLKKAF